jgi:hypothetical protein
VAAQIALRIDALNGEPGQILHILSPPVALCGRETANKTPFQPKAQRWRELWLDRHVVSRENATRYRGAIAACGKQHYKRYTAAILAHHRNLPVYRRDLM